MAVNYYSWMGFMEAEKERKTADLLIDCIICYWKKKKDTPLLLEDSGQYYNQLEENGL